MTNKYSTRRPNGLPRSHARADARAKVILAIGQSQQSLSQVLKVPVAAISRMERHTDIYVSTLRSHIEAMGGQLQVVVRFPEGSVKLSNFIDLDNEGQPDDEPSRFIG